MLDKLPKPILAIGTILIIAILVTLFSKFIAPEVTKISDKVIEDINNNE